MTVIHIDVTRRTESDGSHSFSARCRETDCQSEPCRGAKDAITLAAEDYGRARIVRLISQTPLVDNHGEFCFEVAAGSAAAPAPRHVVDGYPRSSR